MSETTMENDATTDTADGRSGAAALAGTGSAGTQAPETEATSETEAPETRDGGRKNPNAEAAKYRVRLRETEAERDALVERVAALQTRELHRLAGEHLAQPEDLLALGGVELAELLDEDGNVDPEAVANAAAALVEARPGLARNPKVVATDSTQGQGGGFPKAPSWEDLFRP